MSLVRLRDGPFLFDVEHDREGRLQATAPGTRLTSAKTGAQVAFADPMAIALGLREQALIYIETELGQDPRDWTIVASGTGTGKAQLLYVRRDAAVRL